jgi:hypothetical protein
MSQSRRCIWRVALGLLSMGAALVLAGCATPLGASGSISPDVSGTGLSRSPVPSPSPDLIGLGVVNATDLQVSLVVNSRVIETLAPQGADTAIHLSALPPLPWVVQIQTSSGRVLVAMTAAPHDVQGPEETGVYGGRLASVDLSCGQLYLWTGPYEPIWPGPIDSGSPGDCAA